MKYLKSFESANYNDKHFGIPVLDYFPWVKYPDNLSRPSYDLKKRDFYSSFLDKYSFMANVWFIQEGYLVYSTARLGDSENGIFFLNIQDKEFIDGRKHMDVDDWIDVEKIRLTLTLGQRKNAMEYMDIIEEANEIYAVFEDYEDTDSIEKSDYRIFNNNEIMDHVIDYLSDPTEEQILTYVKNYNGNVEFINSLKNYLTTKGQLTWRQIKALKDRPTIEMYGINPSYKCIFISNNILDIIPRLINMGYSSLKVGNGEILYKK